MRIPAPGDPSGTKITDKRRQTVKRYFLVIFLSSRLSRDRVKSIGPSGTVHGTEPAIANTGVSNQLIVNLERIAVVVVHYQIDFWVFGISASVIADEATIVVAQLFCHALTGMT